MPQLAVTLFFSHCTNLAHVGSNGSSSILLRLYLLINDQELD